MSLGVQEMGNSEVQEFRRWRVKEFGNSGDRVFLSLGVYEMGSA